MKFCNKCKTTKEKSSFKPSSRTLDKLNHICRECIYKTDEKRRKELQFYKQFEIV